MPRIIIESHIPFVSPELEQVAEVIRLAPEHITPQAVRDVDALIVRTRTHCDSTLLANSTVRFIATATIGTDHIDLDYCYAKGIKVVSAPGCNAPAVAQYVWASALSLLPHVSGLTIGVVGLGHVGSIVAQWASALGVRVLACDPPRSRISAGWDADTPQLSGNIPFVSLNTIASEAHIITFHTPHTIIGPDSTHHLADKAFFASLQQKPMIINAARGPIVDTKALLQALQTDKVSYAVIDCWEDEPDIDPQLLDIASIATPHIAGYSVEGKQRATIATVAAALRFFNAPQSLLDAITPLPTSIPATSTVTPATILASYNPLADTVALKSNLPISSHHQFCSLAARFEHLRNTYPLRHELSNDL